MSYQKTLWSSKCKVNQINIRVSSDRKDAILHFNWSDCSVCTQRNYNNLSDCLQYLNLVYWKHSEVQLSLTLHKELERVMIDTNTDGNKYYRIQNPMYFSRYSCSIKQTTHNMTGKKIKWTHLVTSNCIYLSTYLFTVGNTYELHSMSYFCVKFL